MSKSSVVAGSGGKEKVSKQTFKVGLKPLIGIIRVGCLKLHPFGPPETFSLKSVSAKISVSDCD